MTMIKADYSDVVEKPSARDIPDGIYYVRILDVTPAERNGKKHLNWEMVVFGCEHSPEMNGAKIYHKTDLDGSFAFQLKNMLLAIDPNINVEEFDIMDLLGKELQIRTVRKLDAKTGQKSKYYSVRDPKAYIASGSTVLHAANYADAFAKLGDQ